MLIRKSKDEFISNVHLWAPTHGLIALADQQKLTWTSCVLKLEAVLENQPRAMIDSDGWRERDREYDKDIDR